MSGISPTFIPNCMPPPCMIDEIGGGSGSGSSSKAQKPNDAAHGNEQKHHSSEQEPQITSRINNQMSHDTTNESEQKPEGEVRTTSQKHISVLVVDDEEVICRLVPRILVSLDHGKNNTFIDESNIFIATRRDKALELMNTQKIDVIISDYYMPGMLYPEFREKALQISPNSRILLMSGTMEDVERSGAIADDYVHKPLEFELFRAAFARLVSTMK